MITHYDVLTDGPVRKDVTGVIVGINIQGPKHKMDGFLLFIY